MPSPDRILEQLELATREWGAVAAGWHALLALALVLLACGIAPTRRAAALLLSLPIASAAAIAAVVGNPFNVIVLAAMALSIAALGPFLPAGTVPRADGVSIALGLVMIGFAGLYPHFVGGSRLERLLEPPLGVIPCPTIALVVGFALLFGALGSRAFRAIVAAAGLFYGLFGSLRLGVSIDWLLVAGASALVFLPIPRRLPITGSRLSASR
jgi:hypothetical protein